MNFFFLQKVAVLLAGANRISASIANTYNGYFPSETTAYTTCLNASMTEAKQAEGSVIKKVTACK